MVVSVVKEAAFRSEFALPVYDATDFTIGGQLAEKTLEDQLCTLRFTRAGKLIPTK